MRVPHIHHWSIRNCIVTIPDTTMIGNIIKSSHAFYFGLRVNILEEKSWSQVRFEPLTSGMASRHANHWATELCLLIFFHYKNLKFRIIFWILNPMCAVLIHQDDPREQTSLVCDHQKGFYWIVAPIYQARPPVSIQQQQIMLTSQTTLRSRWWFSVIREIVGRILQWRLYRVAQV